MSEFLVAAFTVATVSSAVCWAAPYLLAALGETLSQRSGVINLGVDGVMLLSACCVSWLMAGSDNFSIIAAVLAGVLVGVVMGAVHGFVTVVLKIEQHLVGICVFLFGLGASEILARYVMTSATSTSVSLSSSVSLASSTPPASPLDVSIPMLSSISVIGEVLFSHNVVVYAAFLLVPGVALLLNRTWFGLHVRACGEVLYPAGTSDLPVLSTRLKAVMLGSGMAGLAGAALVMVIGAWEANITRQMGFVAVALVSLGSWRPLHVVALSIVYGFITAVIRAWEAEGLVNWLIVDPVLLVTISLTLIALMVYPRNAKAKPAALASTYSSTYSKSSK